MTLEEATKEMTIDEAIKDLEKIKKVKFSPISQPVSMDMAIEALTKITELTEVLREASHNADKIGLPSESQATAKALLQKAIGLVEEITGQKWNFTYWTW